MFTGKTVNLGVIGDPIVHSLSPALQNAALAAAGLDYAYIAMRTAPADLAAAVAGLRALGFRGFNVTIPHKMAIRACLDEIDADAAVIGAVNTVVNEAGQLKGYNTDVIGCIDALRARGFDPQGKTAALLGAGGAAQAVIWGLIKAGAAHICIGVRNVPKVQPLVHKFQAYAAIDLFDWQEPAFAACLGQTDLLVNTTPLGMAPHIDDMPCIDWTALQPGALVYDIIYTPAKTRFLQEAEQQGHPILNGEAMLVGQGAAAFQLWTGREADRAVMTQALRKALRSH